MKTETSERYEKSLNQAIDYINAHLHEPFTIFTLSGSSLGLMLCANTDGSKNLKYCSYCYQEGNFTYRGNNVKEFQELYRQKMIERGQNRMLAWVFTRGMKRLERWKNKDA